MESSLECEVCFTEYNSDEHRPKFLPCGHSICASCVTDTLRSKEGKMACPFCRNPCGTGVKTLDDFPTAFALLNLIGTGKPKISSKTVSPREKEKENLQQKKQAVYDYTGDHISNCNEHLLRITHAREAQESAIQSIQVGKAQLIDDYQQELKRLENEEEKETILKHQLDDVAAEGNDIVKGLEALQDRVSSANSLFGLNMANQDVQKYSTASEEWVSSRVNIILKGGTHMNKEKIISSKNSVAQAGSSFKNSVAQRGKCLNNYPRGGLFYSCLQCGKGDSTYEIIMCGSCFVNSSHWNHESKVWSGSPNAFCDCGISDVWKSDPTCSRHLEDKLPPKAFDTTQQKSTKCKEVFFTGEKCFECLECQTQSNVLLCGSCFLNSSHKDHRYIITTYAKDGAFCDCGYKEVWKAGDTCKLHI